VKRIRVVLIGSAVIGVSACTIDAEQSDIPALIVSPTAESRAELLRVVSGAVGDVDVTLAGNALTTDSMLIIERKPHRDLQHGRIMGRDPGRPEHFRLVKHGDRCTLVQESTGERWPLVQTSCVEAP